MLSILGRSTRLCDGITRREVLRVGALAFGGLTLADVLRARAGASAKAASSAKSVIMVWLRGGPSHIDSYDMKPDAPAEIRGEFSTIATNVPGIRLCEHMPRQAKLMDKLAIVRGIKSNDLGDHTPHYILTGSGDRGKRPAFGSVVSHLRSAPHGMPPYVSLMYEPPGLYEYEAPLYTGRANLPFVPRDEGIENLSLAREVSLDRMKDRRQLLDHFDALRREVDQTEQTVGDPFRERALEMIVSPKVRDAFDLDKEPPGTRERYGKYCENLLMARRLAEAGVSVITLKLGDWDTHEKNFRDMRDQLPQLDQGVEALVTDLYDRGLEKDVAVVIWGEFGRAPQISRGDGRDHWPDAGAALLCGGGIKTGQAIGETDAHGGRHKGTPYTPGNIMANLYQHLGLDPATTLTDHSGRPVALLDERERVREL
ncbi:MAG: DUF1501 domain-containing protein [Planctomycetota bacterium]|nr:MAG: DUF1501 domain-containing protein [Planctomycetota bacterium]